MTITGSTSIDNSSHCPDARIAIDLMGSLFHRWNAEIAETFTFGFGCEVESETSTWSCMVMVWWRESWAEMVEDKKPVNKNVYRIKDARRLPLPIPTGVRGRNDSFIVVI